MHEKYKLPKESTETCVTYERLFFNMVNIFPKIIIFSNKEGQGVAHILLELTSLPANAKNTKNY